MMVVKMVALTVAMMVGKKDDLMVVMKGCL